jgi:hypothetical protein
MRAVKVSLTPYGPRTHVLGRRVHHGLAGAWLALLGIVLMWHDRRDARDWRPRRA